MGIRDLAVPMQKEAPDYLRWVRSLPSGASRLFGCQAHHRIGGRFSQRKVSDFEVMPLTDHEHRQLHSGMEDFVREYGKTEKEMICEVLLEAIRLGIFVYDAKAAKELA